MPHIGTENLVFLLMAAPSTVTTKIVKHLMDNNLLSFEGFHFHLGSQITDFSCYIHAIDKMHNFMTKMKKEFPKFTVNTLDIGGGTPVYYNESVPTPSQMADSYVTKTQ